MHKKLQIPYYIGGGIALCGIFTLAFYRLRQKQIEYDINNIEFSMLNNSINCDYNNQPPGLRNNGNICFVNSVLQVSSQPNFIEYIFNLAKRLNNPESINQKICIQLAALMKYLQSDLEIIDPTELISLLEYDTSFNFFREQQDCHELFNMLLRHIEYAQLELQQSDLANIKIKNNLPTNPFLHYTQVRIDCLTCHKSFQTTKLESHYSLFINIQFENTVYQALKHNEQPEEIQDYICLYCTLNYLQYRIPKHSQTIQKFMKCQDFDSDAQQLINTCLKQIQSIDPNININPKDVYQRRVVKQVRSIAKYPKTLCFYVNRLAFYQGEQIKITRHIQLDQAIKLDEQEYKLTAVVCHLGNSNFGHYVTIKRTFAYHLLNQMEEKQCYKGCQWYLTSDKYVSTCEVPLSEEAYLMFYDSL